MNREIKFRAWDKVNKEMVWVVDLRWKEGLEEINTETYVHFPYEKDTAELMQYTGLKDKNGKEIYEGDIVRSRHLFPDNAVVVWDNALCSFELHNSMGDFSDSEHLLDLSGESDLGYIYWEVIGNIYENPELLEG